MALAVPDGRSWPHEARSGPCPGIRPITAFLQEEPSWSTILDNSLHEEGFYVGSGPSGLRIMSNAARRVRLLMRATIMAKPVSKPK